MNLDQIKEDVLVLDIETCSYDRNRKRFIDIKENINHYIENAITKWIGFYSYKYDKYYNIKVKGNEKYIIDFINEHKYIVTFNGNDFDIPILLNNYLISDQWFNQIDLKVILGSSVFLTKDQVPFKNRGALMGYKFKNNTLREMAKVMDVETQKGDIDFKIFYKDNWTEDEEKEIIKYLQADIEVTKQLFDKVWDFWLVFTDFLCYKDIKNLSWIKSSISSLSYKAACNILNVEDTYAERVQYKNTIGARVIEPKYEEARNVWYVDFTSLYPHMFAMFNLFNEVSPKQAEAMNHAEIPIWHGNDVFKVEGYYDISQQHPLSANIVEKLKQRAEIKQQIKETGIYNPTEYAIKIFLNSLYGAARSSVFEQIHTPNCGADCCYLGQQINYLADEMMTEMGFETIAGDTDSLFIVAKQEKYNNREYVKQCLQKVVEKIKANAPFPAETYNIDIEGYIDYAMWPFSMQPMQDQEGNNIKEGNKLVKKLKGKKKNYLYIIGDKIKIMGMPIKKDGSTSLSMKIYNDILKPQILQKRSAKFEKQYIDKLIEDAVNDKENLKLLAREYKCKHFVLYKNENQIQAQISLNYFNKQDGVISLIKNKKIGKVGKTSKYCTIEEAIEAKLTANDLDLVKLRNELQPFVKNER